MKLSTASNESIFTEACQLMYEHGNSHMRNVFNIVDSKMSEIQKTSTTVSAFTGIAKACQTNPDITLTELVSYKDSEFVNLVLY